MPGNPIATIGGDMSNIWKSFIMTEKKRNSNSSPLQIFIPDQFSRNSIPPMFEATTAMQILLERKKKSVYLSDIFPVYYT